MHALTSVALTELSARRSRGAPPAPARSVSARNNSRRECGPMTGAKNQLPSWMSFCEIPRTRRTMSPWPCGRWRQTPRAIRPTSGSRLRLARFPQWRISLRPGAPVDLRPSVRGGAQRTWRSASTRGKSRLEWRRPPPAAQARRKLKPHERLAWRRGGAGKDIGHASETDRGTPDSSAAEVARRSRPSTPSQAEADMVRSAFSSAQEVP